jgi:hypothetical protein
VPDFNKDKMRGDLETLRNQLSFASTVLLYVVTTLGLFYLMALSRALFFRDYVAAKSYSSPTTEEPAIYFILFLASIVTTGIPIDMWFRYTHGGASLVMEVFNNPHTAEYRGTRQLLRRFLFRAIVLGIICVAAGDITAFIARALFDPEDFFPWWLIGAGIFALGYWFQSSYRQPVITNSDAAAAPVIRGTQLTSFEQAKIASEELMLRSNEK